MASDTRTASELAKGSDMSSKQLARTALKGQRLKFQFSTLPPLEGYLCGMDDYHWMVIDREAQVHLIHKGSAAMVSMLDRSYDDEPLVKELNRIVIPFTQRMSRIYDRQQDRGVARIS